MTGPMPRVAVEFTANEDALVRALNNLNSRLDLTATKAKTVDRGLNTLERTGAFTASSGLRKVENGVANLTLEMFGLTGAAGKVVEGLTILGAGAELLLPIAATVAAVSLAYEALTGKIRDTKKAQDDLIAAGTKRVFGPDETGDQAQVAAAQKRLKDIEEGRATLFNELTPKTATRALFGRRQEDLDAEAAQLRAFLLRSEVDAQVAADQARLAAKKQGIQADLTAEQQRLEALNAINKQEFDQGLESQKLFFERRRGLAQEATDAEVKALQGQRSLLLANPPDATDQKAVVEHRAAVLEIDKKIILTRQEGAAKVNAIDAEEATADEALATARLGFEQKIQAAKGRTLSVAVSSIAQEAQKFDELLAKEGTPAPERRRKVADFTETLTTQAEFTKAQQEATQRLADLDRARATIQQEVATGQITEVAGEKQIAQLELTRLPAVRQIAEGMTEMAARLGDPALIQAAAALNAQLDGIAASANRAGQETAKLKADLQSAAQSSLTEFFGSTLNKIGDANPDQDRINRLQQQQEDIARQIKQFGDVSGDENSAAAQKVRQLTGEYDALTGQIKEAEARTYGLGDAFKDLARSIVNAFQQAVAQMLALKIVEGLFGGGANAATSLVNNDFNLTPGTLNGFASGGYTGPGHKYQPAGVVHAGEFVFDQATTTRHRAVFEAMHAHGVEAVLAEVAAGSAPVMVATVESHAPSYAEGGFVAGDSRHLIELMAPEGWTGKVHSDDDTVQVVVRNKRKIGQILGVKS